MSITPGFLLFGLIGVEKVNQVEANLGHIFGGLGAKWSGYISYKMAGLVV